MILPRCHTCARVTFFFYSWKIEREKNNYYELCFTFGLPLDTNIPSTRTHTLTHRTNYIYRRILINKNNTQLNRITLPYVIVIVLNGYLFIDVWSMNDLRWYDGKNNTCINSLPGNKLYSIIVFGAIVFELWNMIFITNLVRLMETGLNAAIGSCITFTFNTEILYSVLFMVLCMHPHRTGKK